VLINSLEHLPPSRADRMPGRKAVAVTRHRRVALGQRTVMPIDRRMALRQGSTARQHRDLVEIPRRPLSILAAKVSASSGHGRRHKH